MIESSQYNNNILIVEDESIIAFGLEDTLINLGYTNIDIVLNYSDALDRFENHRYDIAILDINLGDNELDGIKLASKFKEGNNHFPIIFLTGNSDHLTVSKAKEVEPNAFIVKPFNENEIKISLDLVFFQRTPQSNYVQNANELNFSRTFLNNHPNFVLRIDLEGNILFVNSEIRRITGKSPEDYVNKSIYNSDLEDDFIELIVECKEKAETKKRKSTIETDVPTVFGERAMFIVIIPEFSSNKEFISVTVLLQDITDQKMATEDLLIRNKKITDSINYSKKLQEALLPTDNFLQNYIPDSSLLLKAKDGVSGDFPWVFKSKNYLFVAAVDCTGHGVPGAFLSMIMHFLLNEIVKLNGDLLPGRVLEILHVTTKKTLKQHMPNVESNDGADIALCRIDNSNEKIIFSGAHRPLFYCRGGEVHQVKGDKQPIGGEHYTRKKKKKTLNFSNTELDIKVNDKFFIFSDGLTDQFGGTQDRPMKFSTNKNIQNILKVSDRKSSHETISHFEKEFGIWKAQQKQIDDVLAICFVPKSSVIKDSK